MKVLSWNVNGTFPPHGSPDRIMDQIEWLDSLEAKPDVLLLQEVNPSRQGLWKELLADRLGYANLRDTLDIAEAEGNSNGHITTAKTDFDIVETITGRELNNTLSTPDSGRPTAYPEKLLITEIEFEDSTIEVCNIRAVPGGEYPEEKLAILELAYDYIEESTDKLRILAGDLNTPHQELSDGQAVTFGYRRDAVLKERGVTAELKILKGLGHFGMIDVFRFLNGYDEIDALSVSHKGRRIDHLFASEALSPIECWYSESGAAHSDHAPVVGVFGI